MHYFRSPRASWSAALQGIASLGLKLVESPVPWRLHERAKGAFDFGSANPSLDLPAFLSEAAAAGLKAILRLGPQVNAELPFFGLPDRIVSDPAMLARTARDTTAFLPTPPRAFPVPSLASQRFLDESAAWLRALADVVRPHLHPNGPIVAIQIEGELPQLLRNGPFDLDYHPDVAPLFREFLEQRYGTEAALAAAWRAEGGFAAASPPRSLGSRTAGDLVRCLDWLAFKEHLAARALGFFRTVLGEAGLGAVPTFHALPPQDPSSGFCALEQALDFAGVDLYHSARHYARTRERCLYLAGTAAFPCVPGLAVGSMPYGLPLDPDEQRHVILGALMHGVRGANLSMAVDRASWYGAPLGADGRAREPLGPFLGRLSQALAESRLFELERRADVAVVLPPVYSRLALATQIFAAMPQILVDVAGLRAEETCREETLGLSVPVQVEYEKILRAVVRGLDGAHVPYVLVDGRATPARLARYRVIVCPTFDCLDRDCCAALDAAAEAGARVVFGPVRPTLDERLLPLPNTLGGEPDLTRELLADDGALARFLGGLVAPQPYAAREPEVDTALFDGPHGPRVLFVGTGSTASVTAHVPLGRGERLRDLLTDETFVSPSETSPSPPGMPPPPSPEVAIPVGAHGVRIFALERTDAPSSHDGEVPHAQP